jgi:hypothetical protein
MTMNGGTTSHYLKATNFGFAIPGGSQINGITCEAKYKQTNPNIQDNSVKMVKGGTIGGNDNAKSGVNWTTTLTWNSYGSSSDLWGLTWTASDINASNFGFVLSCNNTAGGINTPSVDAMRITITYTPQGATPLRQTQVVAPQPPRSSFD